MAAVETNKPCLSLEIHADQAFDRLWNVWLYPRQFRWSYEDHKAEGKSTQTAENLSNRKLATDISIGTNRPQVGVIDHMW